VKRSQIAVLAWGLAVASMPASAQDLARPGPELVRPGPDVGRFETARIRWGPFGVTPRLALTNIGIDTNVLNEAERPRRDFTATLTPGADTWLRVGPLELSLKSSADWTYFRRFSEQGSFGYSEAGRLLLMFDRIAPYISGEVVSTRQRPNFEIDARVRQRREMVGAGIGVRLGGRTWLDVDASQGTVNFGETAVGDRQFADALDRDTRTASAALRVELTPLTTVSVRGTTSQDRFDATVQRNSNSFSLVPIVELQPLALISGRAAVGWRYFDVLDPFVRDYTGIVAETQVSYVMRDMMRFEVTLERNVDYSIDSALPYAVVSHGEVSVSQVIGLDWYVTARTGRAWLQYRSFSGLAEDGTLLPQAGRQDRVTTYGVGIARRIGADLRLGFDVNRMGRVSGIDGRNYDGFRFGGSITYGS
jgi:hypothetical protein